MRWSTVAAIVVLTAAPLVFQTDASADDDKKAKKQVTLRGCVIQGENDGTFVFSHVTEVPPTGEFAMPEWAHGRRVVYWLKNLEDLKGHIGRTVEVQGTLESFKNSEVELKAGRQKSGDLYVEFEGPGKDIKAANSGVGSSVGTAGRTAPEKQDLKTMLAVVDVKHVKKETQTCQ